ncbi:uncharacterized protein LOC126373093 [Pectinophora gossypiella]|uniref:uncharacterized protein LOC126373093 n=1 Tax=Pectinophora gossypiella TaxID=13191 RepID=UPI00214F4F51|nr:uncharacterized protein LOC126373093 [Pectinophora gossypiella]
MFAAIVFCLLFSKSIAQLNGEFWWLNAKLNNLREEPSQPRFETLSKFDTDESAKIVFRDDDHGLTHREDKYNLNRNKDKSIDRSEGSKTIEFQDKSEILWPDRLKETIVKNKNKVSKSAVENKNNSNTSITVPSNSDEFEFTFPDNDIFLWQDARFNNTDKNELEVIVNNNTNKNNSNRINNIEQNDANKITFIVNKVPIKVYKDVIVSQTESICTYMKKMECSRIGGTVYSSRESTSKRPIFETRMVCCVLPLRPEFLSSQIYFFDNYKPVKRLKRSNQNDKINPSLKQRNNLMIHKFGSQAYKARTTTTRPVNQGIVTPSDEYVDPYWNIKNKNSKQPTTKYDDYEDYVEDYVVEIPRPGLVGLYSDNRPSKSSWSYPNVPIVNKGPYGQIDSDEDGGPLFGYAPPTLDPRLGDRLPTSKPRVNGRPVKLTTTSDERTYDIESQTISYQSNPDFQVLQGFKLLNLVRNKSRIFRNGKKTTTERVIEDESKEHVLTASSFESDYDDSSFDKNQQVFGECGKVVKGSNRSFENGKQIGDTQKGVHPWLALVVLTRRRQSVLCYATIVHPRAAITAGDCVFGRASPGEITLIGGTWRLNEEDHEEWQKRMASVQLHPQYKPGQLTHNLALLYWKRPLSMTVEVQPACLAHPHVGDVCKFFGWGGYDQAIRKQSRWQEAVILTPHTCSERVTSKRVPKEAFCASVQSRGTVTGIGGPLMCNVGGRQAAVGVAVWRDHAVVLLPAQEWISQTIADLQL